MLSKWMPGLMISAIGLVILFWSLVTPIFEFPDEQAHVGTVNFLLQNNRIPGDEEWDMTEEMRQTQEHLGIFRDSQGNNEITYHPEHRLEYSNSFTGKYEPEIKELNNPIDRKTYVAKEAARYPRLYYDYVGFWSKAVSETDVMTRVYVMRLANVVLATLMSFFTYKIGRMLFETQEKALILTILVMLQPMFSFLSAGINSDNLHNLLFTIILYCGVSIVKNGFKVNTLMLAVSIVALDIFTKPQGYLGIPILLGAMIIHIVKTKKWRHMKIFLVALITGVGAIISPLNPYRGWLNKPNDHGIQVVDFLSFSLNQLMTQNSVWYWGVFKWLGVVLPPLYWQVANRVVMIAVVGLLLYTWKVVKQKRSTIKPSLVSYAMMVSVIYGLAIYFFDYQYMRRIGISIGVQARYFFPTITTHMTLLMVGILSLSSSVKVERWLSRVLGIFIVWMQLGGVWRLITSYYDVSSWQMFITQVSQYKPTFAKGEWWCLWIGLYVLSLVVLTVNILFSQRKVQHDA
jgi:hypothetical protein